MNLNINRMAMVLMIFLSFRTIALQANESFGICLGNSQLPLEFNLTPIQTPFLKKAPYPFLKIPTHFAQSSKRSATAHISNGFLVPAHDKTRNDEIQTKPSGFKQLETQGLKFAQSVLAFVKPIIVKATVTLEETLTKLVIEAPIAVETALPLQEPKAVVTERVIEKPAPAAIALAIEEPIPNETVLPLQESIAEVTKLVIEESAPAATSLAIEDLAPTATSSVIDEPNRSASNFAAEDTNLPTEAESSTLSAHPFMPPEIYANGPLSPIDAKTDLFIPEMAAYAMLEAAMQQVQTVVSATSCTSLVGTYDIDLYSDGSTFNPDSNFVVVDSPGSSFKLNAVISNNIKFRGQEILIKQFGNGAFKKVDIANYSARVSYNALGSIMNTNSSTNVRGNDGRFTVYQGLLIHNFYRAIDEISGLPLILEYAQNSLSKLGYPIENFWQRSKLLRGDGATGRTVLVKDRFVGPNACRIIVDLFGDNNLDFFWQTGSLIVTTAVPSDEVVEFNL